MPFVFSYEDYFNEDEDAEGEVPDELDAPNLSNFQYCSPSQWGGPEGPVIYKPAEPRQLANDSGSRNNARYDLMEKNATAIVFQTMRDLNIKSAYARYDGGNDEGFIWLDHVVDSAGQKIGAKRLKQMLLEANVLATINRLNANTDSNQDATQQLDHHLITLCYQWLELLLSYWGTGEYEGYGAFRVDLESGLIEDDPKAAPIVQNIRFDGAQFQNDNE